MPKVLQGEQDSVVHFQGLQSCLGPGVDVTRSDQGPYGVTGKMGVERSLGRHRAWQDIGLDLTAADHGWCSNA